MLNMGKYFQQTYDSISGYMPSIPSVFGSYDDDDDDNDDDDEYEDDRIEQSTIKRRPKIKKSALFSRSPNRIVVEEKNNRWYDRFFFGSDSVEDDQVSTAFPVLSSTESSFFGWLSESEESTEKVTAPPVKPPQSASNSNWFSNLFSSDESTTKATTNDDVSTSKPIISNEKKNEWLAMLAAHMGTMTTPTTQQTNRTNILRRVKYDDYQIWRIIPSTHAQLEFLREYKESDENERVRWLKGPAMR